MQFVKKLKGAGLAETFQKMPEPLQTGIRRGPRFDANKTRGDRENSDNHSMATKTVQILHFPANGPVCALQSDSPFDDAGRLVKGRSEKEDAFVEMVTMHTCKSSVATPWKLPTFVKEDTGEEEEDGVDPYEKDRRDLSNWKEVVFALVNENGHSLRLPENRHFRHHPTNSGCVFVGDVVVYRALMEDACGDSALLNIDEDEVLKIISAK